MRASISVLEFFNTTNIQIRYSNQNVGQKLRHGRNKAEIWHFIKKVFVSRRREEKTKIYEMKLNTYNTAKLYLIISHISFLWEMW
jgi:hypothetical protein